MSAISYPVRVDARRDTSLSRWLWLVKWFLAIPHYVVLGFLWLAFVVLSAVAFFAILFTGRYPRPIFDFNVGVLRWTWRVQYYAYGALGTDQYPPFSLREDPGYPAHLEIDYPQRLSRGLVLVKWWLLAIPQYIIIGLFAGGGAFASSRLAGSGFHWPDGGLIGILVLVAAIVLTITGRYPDAIFDFVLGMNRWVLRVAAYAGLMTDRYPPFRLDMGGPEPAGTLTLSPSPELAVPGSGIGERSRGGWTAGRIVSVVAGSVLALIAAGVWAGAAGLSWADWTHRQAGFVTTSSTTFSSAGYAVTTGKISLLGAGSDWLASTVVGKVRIRVTASDPARAVFIGIAPAAAVNRYLSGVRYTTFTNIGGTATPLRHAGPTVPAPPAAQAFWVAHASGTGLQALTWTPRTGNWIVVAMNRDASPGLTIRADAGATLPALWWLDAGLLAVGLLIAAGGILLIVIPARRASRETDQGAGEPVAEEEK